ncbi:uncharacterized protein LOC113389136 [Ctenocephalides felis]|uniref:uncharacterized protein LOC113389136 n=1 Tax=Ctenocephalides felis TaxID=7515 RepID=UPI000E6E19B0|nr:uncharacterized protein LOC113389136 [Ctenocephalides felis]
MRVYPGHLHQASSKTHLNSSSGVVKAEIHRNSSEAGSSCEEKSPDEELAELIKDFRRGARGLAEVERLAEQWRARHATAGAQTQRERDRMLKSMREQYDKLQKQGGANGVDGKMGALERVRKLFARSRHAKENESKGDQGKPSDVQGETHKIGGVIRPMSSLSIHSVSSSSSSGRLSTGSVCSGASLGDSGTHSDNEDRKMSLKHLSIDQTKKQSNFDNYLIPPAPRPLLQLPVRSNIERFTSPTGQEHYIRFPPSNQPVVTSSFNSRTNQTPPLTPVTPQTPPLFSTMDYGNLPAAPLNTIQEAREYVNFRTAAG